MKKFFGLLVSYVIVCISVCNAQDCFSDFNVTIGMDGIVLLSAEEVLIGDLNDYTDLSFEVFTFDCSQLGVNNYELSGNYLGEPFTCEGTILLEDKLVPTAICATPRQPVFTEGVDTIWLVPEYIDDFSYDNCAIQSFNISPLFVTRDDIGVEVTTTLSVTDHSGNTNPCFSTLVPIEGEQQFYGCSLLTVNIGTQPYPVSPEEIVDLPSSEIGPNLILTITDSDGNLVENNLVTQEHIGSILDFEVADMYSSYFCFGKIEVDCAAILICDENSSCTVFGECDSGHSNLDNVEWPCELNLEIPFSGSIEDIPELLTESYLTVDLGLDTLGTIVDIVGFPEQCILITHQDQSIPNPVDETNSKIIRTWTLLDFVSGIAYDYTQLINVDIVPTIDELITWPYDLIVQDVRIHPEELIRISHISPYQAYPIIPEGYEAKYDDNLLSDTGTEMEVIRSWSIYNSALDVVAQNQQIIRVNYDDLLSTISVQGAAFDGVAGIEVSTSSTLTNEQGLTNITTTPADYTSQLHLDQRINLRDRLAIQKFILGMDSLNLSQIEMADHNGDNIISATDLVSVQQLILEQVSYTDNSNFTDKVIEDNFPAYVENKLSLRIGDVAQESICPAYGDRGDADVTLNLEDKTVKPGTQDCLFLYAQGYEDINSFQCVIQFDPDVILINSVRQFDSNELFFTPFVNGGQLIILYGHTNLYTTDQCVPLMEICFDVIGEVGESALLSFEPNDPNTITEVTTLNESNMSVPLSFILDDALITVSEDTGVTAKSYQLLAEDFLLNAGESYSSDFYLQDFQEVTDGIQVKLQLDNTIDPQSIDVSSSLMDSIEFAVSEDDVLTLILTQMNAGILVDLDENMPLFTLSFTASENGLLSTSLIPIGELSTFISDSSRSMYLLDVEVTNAFVTGLADEESIEFSLYPNPVTDILYFDGLKSLDLGHDDLKVSIYSASGTKVYEQFSGANLDVNFLSQGIYYLQINTKDLSIKKRFIKVD